MTDVMTTQTEAQREVRSKQIAAGPARTAVIRASYPAKIEDVWAAWTEPNRLNRWYLQVNGDLRVGGNFQIEGNANGEIKRCEAPRLLAVTWVYGDRPIDEVELRLTPDANGGTTVEIEHATASALVDWEGQQLDPLPSVGAGWETVMAYALPAYLRGELPDKPASEWFEFTPEMMEIGTRIYEEWMALLATPAQ